MNSPEMNNTLPSETQRVVGDRGTTSLNFVCWNFVINTIHRSCPLSVGDLIVNLLLARPAAAVLADDNHEAEDQAAPAAAEQDQQSEDSVRRLLFWVRVLSVISDPLSGLVSLVRRWCSPNSLTCLVYARHDFEKI